MQTLDYSSANKLAKSLKEVIAISFPTSATNLDVGAMVKLGSDGEVSSIAAATDLYIGIVESPNTKYKDSGKAITVRTRFKEVVLMEASAAVAVGAAVAIGAYNGTTKYNEVAAAASGNYVAGIALEAAAADGDVIRVGVLMHRLNCN